MQSITLSCPLDYRGAWRVSYHRSETPLSMHFGSHQAPPGMQLPRGYRSSSPISSRLVSTLVLDGARQSLMTLGKPSRLMRLPRLFARMNPGIRTWFLTSL